MAITVASPIIYVGKGSFGCSVVNVVDGLMVGASVTGG